MSTGVIEIKNLVKTFPTKEGLFNAVDDIELITSPGEFVTLLGPSGCGKTTTLRMVAGFETPTNGSITLDGEDMLRLTPDKRPMSMVFQSYALFPHLNVFENVAYGLKLKKIKGAELREQVESALVSMDLMKYIDRAPSQMSGGQQQRVALARAMVMRPKVLLFDEPLSNLDAKLRVQMRAEIRRLQQKIGITALYVTHDQDEAMSLSDRIVVMNKGKIEQIGTPMEIYLHPATVFVADFIGSANFLEAKLLGKVGDKARISILGQERLVAAVPDLNPNGSHVLMVRPESVLLTKAAAGDSFGVDVARITNAVFYGATVEYEVETPEGTIIATVSDPSPSTIFQAGDLVKLNYEDEKGWLLNSD